MKRRGLSFAELLIALAILTMLVCGSLIFLQTHLMGYRRQISAVRAAFLGQDLLERFPMAAGLRRGNVEDFDYSVDVQATTRPAGAWLHLTFSQGRYTILRQSLWRPAQARKIAFQEFASQQWHQIEADGPAEMLLPVSPEAASSDGQALLWKGKQVFQSDSWISQPQANASQTQIAFLCAGGSEVWVFDLKHGRARCWQRGLQVSDPPRWLTQSSLLVCQGGQQLLSLSVSGTQVLYEGPSLSSPSVSPDGARIAFIGRAQDTNDIFVLDRRTRQVKNITHSEDGEIRPLWSPDGERILFALAPVAGGSSLGCIQADGSGRQDLHVTAHGNHWDWVAPQH